MGRSRLWAPSRQTVGGRVPASRAQDCWKDDRFLTFDDQCEVTFQVPGYAATARIQRDTGKYSLSTTCNDLISILNDLHKGRQAGPVWSWVIDISAIVSALVTFSGFVLVFYLKQNRVLRIATAVVGAVVLLWMILIATS